MDDFFGIGMGEILLVLVVAIIVVGPEKMVELARSLGRIMNNLRKASNELTAQVTRELEEDKKMQQSPQSDSARPDKNA